MILKADYKYVLMIAGLEYATLFQTTMHNKTILLHGTTLMPV